MYFEISETDIQREREAARALRKSRWWQNKIANGSCHYCNSQINAKTATMDHILPVSRGGRSVAGNVVVACKACNTAKKDNLASEWEEFLVKAREVSQPEITPNKESSDKI